MRPWLGLSLVTLAATAMASCAAAPAVPTSRVAYMRPGGTMPIVRGATYDGPLLVETVHQPFSDAVEAETERVAAAAVKAGVTWRTIDTVTSRALRPNPAYVLRILFDPPPATPARAACETPVSVTSVPEKGTLSVLMVICSGLEIEAAARGAVARPTGPKDPAFAALLRQMTRQVTPPYDDQKDHPTIWPE